MSDRHESAVPGGKSQNRARWRLPLLDYISPGSLAMLVIAAVTCTLVLAMPYRRPPGLHFWIFAQVHYIMYSDHVAQWNKRAAEDPDVEPVNLYLVEYSGLVRRALAAFWSGIPSADMIEIERSQIGNFFTGPLEGVGFVDLTDRLHEEGIYDRINPPSFSAWTKDGHIFGLPHDVHPVLLCYRADLVEAAGIDVSQIETWDDFVRVMSPLMKDFDGDGKTDRYLIDLWYTRTSWLEMLTLQAGGGTVDPDGELIIDSNINARVIAYAVSWCLGPDRIAIDTPENESGYTLWREGRVIAQLMPDWQAGQWKNYIPELSGKLKLMPLPVWEPGGRRTSVRGGTMMGFPKTSPNFEQAWAFAKNLYLSEGLARKLFETNHIISPVRELWDANFYHQPDPYFSNQKSGELYIEQAPNVPLRTSSPFHSRAIARMSDAAIDLYYYADANKVYDPEKLQPKAKELLERAEDLVRQEISRNVFIGGQDQ